MNPLDFPWNLLVPLGIKVIELGLRLWIEHLKTRPPRPPVSGMPPKEQPEEDQSKKQEDQS